MKNLAEEARAILQNYVDKEHGGITSRAVKTLGLSNMTLDQCLDGKRAPNLENLSPVFEMAGISFSSPGREAGADVSEK